MPSLYGDNLEAVVSGGEQVTADLGEALYLVMEGQKGEQGDRGPQGPLAELDASYDETTKTLTLGTNSAGFSIDDHLSDSSENPVQNKVVTAELNAKQDKLTAGQNITISGSTISADVDSSEIASNVSAWLDDNVNPVGSAVVVDSSLTVSGAAADAKATGDGISSLGLDLEAVQDRVFKTTTKSGKSSINLEAGNGVFADTKILYFTVPANTQFSFKADFDAGVSKITAVYRTDVNGTRSAIWYQPESGAVYSRTYETETVSFSLYVENADVSANSTISLTVFYSSENENSIEEQIEPVSRLNTEVFSPEEVPLAETSVAIVAETNKSATETVNFSAGTKYKLRVDDPDGHISAFYLYINGSSDYTEHFPNYDYFLSADDEIETVGIYVDSSFAVSSGTITFEVTELIEHPDSIEARLNDLSVVADYVQTGITDGYTLGRVVENGTFYARGYLSTGNPNRIRTSFIPIKTGDKIVIENGSFQHACALWEGEPSIETNRRSDRTFRAENETINAEFDGYIVIDFRKADDADISVADFDGTIKLYNTFAYHAAMSSSTGPEIPSYYEADNYIKNKAARINALGSAGDDVFIFITDVHWELNAKHSPGLINYLSSNCKIVRMFDGGDLADTITPGAIRAYRENFDGKIYRLCGNHDWFTPATGKSLYYWLNSENNDQIGKPFGHYWYVDNVQQKIRYITLNSFKHTGDEHLSGWQYGFDADQIAWFTNEALNVPAGYDVIVFAHWFRNSSGGLTGSAAIESAIASFNADTSTHGKVICIFQGHAHWDTILHTSSGVPVITTTCDKYDISNEPELAEEVRTLGTINEQAFDVCVLNREAKTITCVRIGALAQNNVDVGRTDTGFTFAQTLEERVVSYE